MFKIRQAQMEVFKDAASRNFENDMIAHLKTFAPKHSEILGDEGVRKVLALGMDRAACYGLTNRGPVRFYIEMMFMLGSYFDTDPQLFWASAILNDVQTFDQGSRVDRLYLEAMKYVHAVGGPNAEYAKAALRRTRSQRFEELPQPGPDFDRKIIEGLKMVYPEKCQYLGDEILRALISHGKGMAEQEGIASDRGPAVVIGLTFALGHGFANDPQFPWIERTLTSRVIPDGNRHVERLHAKAMTYLDNVLLSYQVET